MPRVQPQDYRNGALIRCNHRARLFADTDGKAGAVIKK